MPEKNDTQSSRKYLLTINNPQDHGLNRDAIKLELSNLKSVAFYCISDEIGLETHTFHTHIFLYSPSPIRFSRLKKLFPDAHIDRANGTVAENRAYVEKSGKWANDPKADTSVPDSFETWGTPPDEPGPGFRSDIVQLYELIKQGYSDAEILQENPELAAHINKFDKIRQTLIEDEYSGILRQDLQVIYVQGPPGAGKSRDIIERHGIEHVYRVLDYDASGKWDFYKPVVHDAVVLEEYQSSLKIGLLLDYADIYPTRLSARYADKVGTYHFLYIVSNWRLEEQYENVQSTSPETWKALLRRIRQVQVYNNGTVTTYTVEEYYKAIRAAKNTAAWLDDAEAAEEVSDKNHAGPDSTVTQDELPL